jgi:hypothetical protein
LAGFTGWKRRKMTGGLSVAMLALHEGRLGPKYFRVESAAQAWISFALSALRLLGL